MATIRTSDFIDTIGVNTHLNYTDGHYANVAKVLSALNYLGIHNLRDAIPRNDAQGQLSLLRVAGAGYKFDFETALSLGEDQTFKDLDAFLARRGGSVSAIEGPNEIDNFAVSFHGDTGRTAAIEIQSAIYARVHGDAKYAGIAVYNLTNSTSVDAPTDYANVHTYSKNGDPLLNDLIRATALQTSEQPGLPKVLTETGYADLKTTSDWEGVDQATQAKLTLDTLMDSVKLGYSRTYIYELLDAYPDPSGTDLGKHLGLFDYAFKPKQVATAIHNLVDILDDDATDAATFAPTALTYTLAGAGANVGTLTMEKANGAHEIVLWANADIWDQARDVAIAAPVQTITATFADGHKDVSVFDPLVSDTAIATYHDVASVNVAVTDHPVIVEVVDLAGSGSGGGTGGTGTGAATSPLAAFLDALGGGTPVTLSGTAGGDGVYGTAAAELAHAGAGNDLVLGGGGADRLYGDDGNDVVQGGSAAALLSGDAGDDTLYAGGPGQYLSGGSGADTLFGAHDGHTTFDGGAGADTYYAYGSDNLFYLPAAPADAASGAWDKIVGWTAGDRIDIGVAGSAGDYFEGTAATLGAAATLADALFNTTDKLIAVYAVDGQLAVFGDVDAAHAGADVALVIAASLSAIDYANFY